MQGRSLNAVKGLFTVALVSVLSAATISCAKGKAELSPAAKAGQKLFDDNCAMCHYADQTNTKIGPGLKGILKNKELPFSHKPATVTNVREQIEKGNPDAKPMPMPPFGSKFSAKQLANLMAYLQTL